MRDWELRVDTAGVVTVAEHLAACDAGFMPRLSERVALSAYARKIRERARTFEAWADGALVGLVAAYVNDPGGTAFVTSVSVLPRWTGRGIASALLEACVAHARAAGLARVHLEVGEANASAIRLYRRLGFADAGARPPMLTMELPLDGREDR